MSLRWRVAFALIAVVVPTALGFAMFSYHLRREGLLETTYQAVVARMESGGRERCEARESWMMGSHRRGRGRGRGVSALLGSYDAHLVSSNPSAPVLSPSIGEAFATGEVAVLDPASTRGAPRVALRMPWDEGPCAVLLVPAPGAIVAGGFLRDLGFAFGTLLLALLAATLALGPPLRRLGQLSASVQAAGPTGALKVPMAARGKDEIGVLAEALERSAASARAHVEELQARDRALREYVDGTTHDLALPLTVIQGHLAALSDGAEHQRPADPTEIAGAAAAANYLAQLSANLAAAARLEGKEVVERRAIDVGALIERVIGRLMPIARHRKVELAASLPDQKVLMVGDELLLERALANLVHNAIRHRGPEPGHVAVLLADHPLSLTVKGDGHPIDDAALTSLRAGQVPPDPARTRGRGLGLSIVRKVAALHDLSLRFEQGEGGSLEVALRAP